MERFAVMGDQHLADLLGSCGVPLVCDTAEEGRVAQELSKLDYYDYIVVAATPISSKLESFLKIIIRRGACALVVKNGEDAVALPSVRVVDSTDSVNTLLEAAELNPIQGGDIALNSPVPTFFYPEDDQDDVPEVTPVRLPTHRDDEVVPTKLAPTPEPLPIYEPPAPEPQPTPEPLPIYEPPAPEPQPTPEPLPIYEPPAPEPQPMSQFSPPPPPPMPEPKLPPLGNIFSRPAPVAPQPPIQQPIPEPTPEPEPTPATDTQFARHIADTLVDRNAGMVDTQTIAPIFGLDQPERQLAKVLVVFSGKGGSGKTSTSMLVAKIAASANPNARIILVDGNVGQGDIRSYLFSGRCPADTPSISDYAIGAKMSDCLLPPSRIPLDDVGFYTLLAPEITESMDHIDAAVYGKAVEELRTVSDLVIIDTQTAEVSGRSSLINQAMIPIIRSEGGYGLCIFDSTQESVHNGTTLLQAYVNSGVNPPHLFAIFNRLVISPSPDALIRLLNGLATLAGAVPDMSSSINSAAIVRSLPADSIYTQTILKVLSSVTGDPIYESAMQQMSFTGSGSLDGESVTGWMGRLAGKIRRPR